MASEGRSVFWSQFWALCRKNWIVLSRHKVLNLIRCLILPFAYGIFLAVAQLFLIKPNHYGLGQPTPISLLRDVYDPSLALVWADGSNLSSTTHPSPTDVMNLIIQNLKPEHRHAVRKVDSPDDIPLACPQNFNLFSECWAAVAFGNFPDARTQNLTLVDGVPNTTEGGLPATLNISSLIPSNFSLSSLNLSDPHTIEKLPFTLTDPPNGTDILQPRTLLNYTIRGDAGLGFIDVIGHTSDFEKRVLPLQWAIDSAIIQLQTGSDTPPPTPLEWPYSIQTDEQQSTRIRLSYIRGLRTLLVLALFINFLGIVYQLPGLYVTERSTSLTAHMRAMGLRDLPRTLSWLVSLSLAYLASWILTGLIWHFRIFTHTHPALLLLLHILTGLSLASYSLFLSLPNLSPSLSASIVTIVNILLAILALVFTHGGTVGEAIFLLIFPPSFFVFVVRCLAGWEVRLLDVNVWKGDPDGGVRLGVLIFVALIDIFLYPWLTVLLERKFYDAHSPASFKKVRSTKSTLTPSNTLEKPSSSAAEPPAIVVTNLSKLFRSSFFRLPRFLRPWSYFADEAADPRTVTAVQSLSLTIPRRGIFVLLGSNGAGKSTVLGILAGLVGRTGGRVAFPSETDTADLSKVVDQEGIHSVEGGHLVDDTRWAHARTQPPKGTLGIVPQRNVLFPELTCFQTVKLFRDIKRRHGTSNRVSSNTRDSVKDQISEIAVEETDSDLERLLTDCGLKSKMHANAGSLSGGQKRKLQLAVGLVGGSEIVLVDECTSGVDPLSRRSIWRTLTSVKTERTIVFTTHFLDEADLLADNIAILAAPGKLVAQGTPVNLKSRLGKGYTLRVVFLPSEHKLHKTRLYEILTALRSGDFPIASDVALLSSPSTRVVDFALNSKDSNVVKRVLDEMHMKRHQWCIEECQIHGTSIEDIFLELMSKEGGLEVPELESPSVTTASDGDEDIPEEPQEHLSHSDAVKGNAVLAKPAPTEGALALTHGRKLHPLRQSLIVFYKRLLIARQNWFPPLLTFIVAICGACIPLFFMQGLEVTCEIPFDFAPTVPLYLGNSPYSSLLEVTLVPAAQEGLLGEQVQAAAQDRPNGRTLIAPPGLISSLGVSISGVPVVDIPDNTTFTRTIQQNYRNLSLGGLLMNLQTDETLIAWQASPPGLTAPTLLNLASNVLYNRALNQTGNAGTPQTGWIINAMYQALPAVDGGTLFALKWVAFFGATMGAYPAFFALYTSMERRTSIQAMQLSNGLTNPAGLWLGHLMFDGLLATLLSSVIVIIFKTTTVEFNGVGYIWVVMVLFGFTSALFSYCFTLFTPNPLAAFAAVAGYGVLMFIVSYDYLLKNAFIEPFWKLYLAGYLLTITYGKNSQAADIITIIHFTVSLLSPVCSVLRAVLVSINLFSLLCSNGRLEQSSFGSIKKFGGPIVYLIVQGLVYFAILVYVDSGSILPRWLQFMRPPSQASQVDGHPQKDIPHDVLAETDAVEKNKEEHSLRVLHVSKTFGSADTKAVDDVTFGVSKDTVFAMLGPNGAGKTSTFNVIRGDIYPDSGDVYINGASIIEHPNTARLSLGVCPQFTAIDPQLTVRQHLIVYGLLKGLRRGTELSQNIESLLRATTLSQYADRLAIKLSGGNQRKLSFAIALIGNPSVILIDEYSTGIDAATKRNMWITFRRMAVGKAVVITTHSMEEASALANKVGILAGRMLAIDTIENLARRYPLYEVHLPARTRDEVVKAQQLMVSIPGSRMADDVATRFEVPIKEDGSTANDSSTSPETLTLSQLFDTLNAQNVFTEYTVERMSLESVFLKVIQQHNIQEENSATERKTRRLWRF